MFGKRKRTIGLYIGSQTIAMAQARVTSSGATVIDQLVVADTPPDTVDSAGIDDADAISRVIHDLLTAGNVGTKDVALVISMDSVIMRLLTLPEMPRNEMMEVLRGEVENYAALAGEDSVLDFQIVNRKVGGIGQKWDMLVVATTRALFDSYISAVETAAHLRLTTVEAALTAVVKAITSGVLENTQDRAMIACIEENNGMIAVVLDGIVRFTHTIESGSGNFAEGLADELKSCLSYYQMTFPQEQEIKEIILFMDGDNSGVICEQLSGYLDVPVVCPQLRETASERIKEQATIHSLSACAAIGAAARAGTTRDDESVNLLNPQGYENAELKKKAVALLVCMVSMIFLSLGASFALKATAKSIMKRAISVQQDGDIANHRIFREISRIETEAAWLETQVGLTKAVVSSEKRLDWAEILQEIGAIIPKTIWLTELSWEENDDLNLEGYARSFDSVFKFRDTLTDSPYFDSVKLDSAMNREIQGSLFVEFQMLCGTGNHEIVIP